MVSVCSHRYINVLDVMALSKIFPSHSYANITFPEPLRKMAVEWLHGLLRSLQKINTELNMVAENPDLMVCTINYRPQGKLRQGNVFTGVCQSTGSRVSLVLGSFWGWVMSGPISFPGVGYPEGGQSIQGVGYPPPHLPRVEATSAVGTHPTGNAFLF